MRRFLAFALLLALTAQPSSSHLTRLKITVRDYLENTKECTAPNGMIPVPGSTNEYENGGLVCRFMCKSDSVFTKYCEEQEFKVLRTEGGEIFPQHCKTCDFGESDICTFRASFGTAAVTKYPKKGCNFKKHCRKICSETTNSFLNCDVFELARDYDTCNTCNALCKEIRRKECQKACGKCQGGAICDKCFDNGIITKSSNCQYAPQFR